MRVNKVVDIKAGFRFQAPVFPTALQSLKRGKNEDIDAGELSNKVFNILDLNDFLAPKPKDIYLVRVSGESMIDERIFDGDILIVDKKSQPKNGNVVIASLNGEMTVKYFRVIEGKVYLVSANKKFLPIEIFPYMQFQIQGVVKHVIHDMS